MLFAKASSITYTTARITTYPTQILGQCANTQWTFTNIRGHLYKLNLPFQITFFFL